jgi:MFS family permease
VALYGINRLVIAGFLTSTFGLFLLERFGDPVQVFNRSFGVATLTGIGLGVSTLIAMLSAPIFGALSDRLRSRWRSAAAGLFHGTLGFSLLAIGSPLAFLLGVPFVALTSGSNQGLSTTLIGETGHAAQRSRRLGLLFTVGDLTSALGPLVAYALIPRIQIQGVYLLAASLFGLMLILSLYLSFRLPQPTEVEKGSLRALPDPESASRPDPVYRPDE